MRPEIGRFGSSYCGLSLFVSSLRVIVVLFTDRVCLHKLCVAISGQASLVQHGLRSLELGFGTGHRGFINSRINLIKRLSFLDLASFLKEPFLQNTGDLRTDIRNQVRSRTALKRRCHVQLGRLDFRNGNLRSPLSGSSAGSSGRFLRVASAQHRDGKARGNTQRRFL